MLAARLTVWARAAKLLPAVLVALTLALAPAASAAPPPPTPPPPPFHSAYHTVDEVSAFLHAVAANHSDHAQVLTVGTTYERRPIEVLHLTWPGSHKLATDERPCSGSQIQLLPVPQPGPESDKAHESAMTAVALKPRILINAGTHAREWVGPAAALYMVDRLLSALDRDEGPRDEQKHLRRVLNTFDIIVVPLLNPDGYAYSWTHKRMWRRNRQPTGEGCTGIDINLNFDYAFQGGPLADSCAEYYAGSSPFDAAEAHALSALINGSSEALPGPKVSVVLDLHAYGQQLMYPFASSCATPVPDEEDLLEAALGAVKEVRSPGNPTLPGTPAVYSSGRVCELLVGNWGNSIDWAYAHAGVKWSFALELRDTGSHGYRLPASRITAAGEDARRAFLYLANFVRTVRLRPLAPSVSCNWP